MSKVLIVSYSFPPDNVPAAQRPYFMAKYLGELNNEVIVLTAENADSSLGKSNWANLKNLKIVRVKPHFTNYFNKRNNNSVSLNSNNSPGSSKKHLKSKIINELLIPDKGIFWYLNALKEAKKLAKNNHFDAVFSTSPSFVNHLISSKIHKKFKIKWIADLRDYYFIEVREKEPFIFRKKMDAYIEKRVLKKANTLTFISEAMKKEYGKRYPFIKNKSFVIYNGVDEEEFKGEREKVDQKKLTIFYAGSFYGGIRSPFPLLKTLDFLSNENKIDLNKIEIKIAGNLDDTILTKIKTFSSGKTVNYLGRIKRSEVLTYLKKSHLLWLIIGEEKAHYTGFPVKGFEYIGARRPIIVFTPKNSEPERIINELSCGRRFSNGNENIEYNANNFMNFYNKYLDNSLNNPLELNEKELKKYTRKFQAKQLKDLIDKL